MTAWHIVAEVVSIWIVGWKLPFSVIFGLVSLCVWVGPWYLNDPDCVFAIRRETKWGNAISVLVNAFLGYILWPATLLCFIWMLVKATFYHLQHGISFWVALRAIYNNEEDKLPLPTTQARGGETAR